MKHTFKRVLSLLCATLMLLGCFAWSAVAAEADMGDTPSGTMQIGGAQKSKWTIIGTDTTYSVKSGGTMTISKSSMGLDLPDSMDLDGLALYVRMTHTAESAAWMNQGSGQIELAKDTCDHYEINVSDNQGWVKGENKVLIPLGKKGTFTDGSTAPTGRFNLHDTINHFRWYSLKAPMDMSVVVHEISVVDITGVDTRTVGSSFSDSDTYLQMASPLTTAPTTIEGSIKMDADIVAYDGMWEIGLPANGRYSFITTTTGTVGESDATTGLPVDTAYKSYTIPKYTGNTTTNANGNQVPTDGYLGTSDIKFTAIKIPGKYTKDDLALTFWVYWNPSVSGTPFNLYSYIELTSSGKSDTNELCWVTTDSQFKNMKEGWNRIVLPFSKASVAGGDIDLSNINFTRIWGNTSANYLTTCDYELRFTSFKIIALDEQEDGAEKTTSWSLGLPGTIRTDGVAADNKPTATVDGKYYESTNPVNVGTVTAQDVATYGMPAGLQYVGGTVRGGYGYSYTANDGSTQLSNNGGGNFGLSAKAMKTVSVPDDYGYGDLALVFWLYTSTGSLGYEGKYPDINTGSNGYFQLELTSAGKTDVEEIYWDQNDTAFKNVKAGWNLIVLPFSEATKSGGEIDLKGIDYTRWISTGTVAQDVTIYVSEMSIMALPKVEDTYEYWSFGANNLVRTDYGMVAKSGTTTANEALEYDMPYGLKWNGGTVNVGGHFGLNGFNSSTPITIPQGDYTAEDLLLVFWLYTSTGKLDGSNWYVELRNAGAGGDNYELYWRQSHEAFQNLQVGWNKIVLPFKSATKEGANSFTLDKEIKYNRIWSNGNTATEAVDIYITEMFIVANDTSYHSVVDGRKTWELVDFKHENGNWDGAVRTFGNVWKNDGTGEAQPADGTVYMKVTPSSAARVTVTTGGKTKEAWKAGFDVQMGKGMNPPIISTENTMDNLVFSFWMYLPDASLVPTDIVEMPNFELTSDGNADGDELEYKTMFAGGLKDGWNYIEVPLSKMSAKSTFDLYNINYLRWSAMRLLTAEDPADEYVYFADFRLTSTISNGKLVDATEIDMSETYTILSTNDSTDANPITLFVNYQGNPGFVWGDKAYVAENYCAITGEWVDLALTYDAEGNQFVMYANGEVISYVDATGASAITPTVGFAIGADVDGSNHMDGYLADIRIWSDVRTQEEIASARVADKEAYGAVENGLTAQTQGLIGAWTLVGGIDYVLETKPDISASNISLVYRGSRVDQWEFDYEIPTDIIGEDYYSIVFIGDTQNLISAKNGEWEAVGQWIVDNIETENIVHVIGAGDTTWNDTVGEYVKARKVWDMFTDKVSWSNIIGNHDYPWKSNTQTIRDTTNYATYYGIDYINSTMGSQYYMGSFNDPYGLSGTENSYYRFNINGTPWMILQLEYHPRVHVIEWANEIAGMFPEDNIILTTHGYIGGDSASYSTHWMTYTKEDANNGGYIGSLLNPPQEWHYSGIDGLSDKSSEEPIWTHLIYNNPNIKMLLCGHASTTDGHILTRWDENVAGDRVPQLMINAQDVDTDYFDDYMMGMIGILRFSADGSKCEIQYYSPYHEASYHPSNQHMRSIELALNEKEEEKGTEGLVFTPSKDGASYIVSDYTGEATDVIVPATHKGLPVSAFITEGSATLAPDGSIVLPEDMLGGGSAVASDNALNSITFLSKTIAINDGMGLIGVNTIVYGYVNSTAQAFAKSAGLQFEYLASISGVSVSLGSDIGLIYSTYLSEEDAAKAEMQFVMNGVVTTATAVETATEGKYTFTLTGKGPHLMRDNVTAKLLVDGKVVATLDEYSVRRYCLNIMNKIDAGTLGLSESKSTALRTLIADLLEYGAVAQVYANYKVMSLANEGVTGKSTYVPLTDEYAPDKLEATLAADGSRFISGTVELTDVLSMHIVFAADKANINKVKVTVNGRVYTSRSFEEIGASTYEGTEGLTLYKIVSPAIYATEFEEKCALVLSIDGVECQTFNYSVVNYIYRQQNVTTNENLVTLLRAIRNYGLAAEAYRDAQ